MEMLNSILTEIRANTQKSLSARSLSEDEILQRVEIVKAITAQMLAQNGRTPIWNEQRLQLIRFYVLYFEGDPACEKVFPAGRHKVRQNTILIGPVGTGKNTMLLVLSQYLRLANRKHHMNFNCYPVTRIIDHYQQFQNLNKFTWNGESPQHIAINDLGIKTFSHYKNDMHDLLEFLLLCRDDIYLENGKRTHITTNMDQKDLVQYLKKNDDRLPDRLKTYNVLTLNENSLR